MQSDLDLMTRWTVIKSAASCRTKSFGTLLEYLSLLHFLSGKFGSLCHDFSTSNVRLISALSLKQNFTCCWMLILFPGPVILAPAKDEALSAFDPVRNPGA